MIPQRPSGMPLVMGVVNVTPDSFSDGGQWFEPEAAVAHGRDLLAQGADLLDVGGESTRPGAERPSLEEELRRVLPVVAELAGVRYSPDGQWLFVNIQYPGATYAITGPWGVGLL